MKTIKLSKDESAQLHKAFEDELKAKEYLKDKLYSIQQAVSKTITFQFFNLHGERYLSLPKGDDPLGFRDNLHNRRLETVLEEIRARTQRMEESFAERDKAMLASFNALRSAVAVMENNLVTQANNLSRLQTDMTAVRAQGQANADGVNALKASISTFAGKFDTIIDQLRALQQQQQNNGDDDTAVGKVADDAEALLGTLKSEAADVTAANLAIAAAGVTPTISPASAIVPAGGTANFSADIPVNWSANTGSIGIHDGLYVAPSDGSTSDTITATSQGDPSRMATALVTVSAASPVNAAPTT